MAAGFPRAARTRPVPSSLLFAILLALGGCASGGAREPTVETSVIVQNDLLPPASVSVWAVPEVGSRRLIGIVNPTDTKTLRFEPVAGGGLYRFVAETNTGAEVASNSVTVEEGATVTWGLTSNVASVME